MRDDSATERQLRKQLLQARARIERAEMMEAVDSASRSSASLRHRIPGFALGKSLPLALQIVQRLRLIKPLVSALPLALAAARRPVLRYCLIGGASALLIWKGWKLLADQRGKTEESEDRGDSPETLDTSNTPV